MESTLVSIGLTRREYQILQKEQMTAQDQITSTTEEPLNLCNLSLNSTTFVYHTKHEPPKDQEHKT